MKRNYELSREGSVLTIVLGEYLSAINSPMLTEDLAPYVNQGIDKVIFDATNLTYISSGGIRVIFFCKKTLSKENVEIVFLNTRNEILEVFDLVGIQPFITFING